MTQRLWILGLILCAGGGALAAGDRISWDKAEAAYAKAAASGRPICFYFVNNEFNKDAAPPLPADVGKVDAAFNDPHILKRSDQFVWVRGDQTLSNKFKVRGAPMVVITDAEGEVLHRASVVDLESLLSALVTVLKEKYVNVPVAWGGVIRTGPIQKKLLVVGFDDAKGEGLKVLEDRTLVKYHKSCEFVRLVYEKGSETARKWGVTQTPAIIICDADEQVLEKLVGEKSSAQVRSSILKALKKLEAPKERRR